ncbi:hypothetical protein RDI58_029085 [Solanum bulbocastanum]|uniref:Uncharacterized protein n=1 Tax=Solanum bulbocastanum TaxID=147425 RepID=A0AAN8XZL5_SOLBU
MRKLFFIVTHTIHKFVCTKFSCFADVHRSWPYIVKILKGWQPRYSYKNMRCLYPPICRYKCNIHSTVGLHTIKHVFRYSIYHRIIIYSFLIDHIFIYDICLLI